MTLSENPLFVYQHRRHGKRTLVGAVCLAAAVSCVGNGPAPPPQTPNQRRSELRSAGLCQFSGDPAPARSVDALRRRVDGLLRVPPTDVGALACELIGLAASSPCGVGQHGFSQFYLDTPPEVVMDIIGGLDDACSIERTYLSLGRQRLDVLAGEAPAVDAERALGAWKALLDEAAADASCPPDERWPERAAVHAAVRFASDVMTTWSRLVCEDAAVACDVSGMNGTVSIVPGPLDEETLGAGAGLWSCALVPSSADSCARHDLASWPETLAAMARGIALADRSNLQDPRLVAMGNHRRMDLYVVARAGRVWVVDSFGSGWDQ